MKEIEIKHNFKITGTEPKGLIISWINNFGERKVVPDSYNQTTIFLERKN